MNQGQKNDSNLAGLSRGGARRVRSLGEDSKNNHIKMKSDRTEVQNEALIERRNEMQSEKRHKTTTKRCKTTHEKKKKQPQRDAK